MQHICCEGNVTGLQCVYLINIIIVIGVQYYDSLGLAWGREILILTSYQQNL